MTGWNETDVDEYFTPTDRDRLVQAVNTFQAVAKPLNPYRPAPTLEQIETARPALGEIIQLLEFDRYADSDAFTTGKRMVLALASNPPAELVELRFNTDNDWYGDPGIWIWGILKAAACKAGEMRVQQREEIKMILSNLCRAVDGQRFPFISFRSVKDFGQKR